MLAMLGAWKFRPNHKEGSISFIADRSSSYIISCTRGPDFEESIDQHEVFELAELQSWHKETLQPYSVHFHYIFFKELEDWATGRHEPACLAFLKHTSPKHFKQTWTDIIHRKLHIEISDELVPLRKLLEEARACKLEHLEEMDEQEEIKLDSDMKQLAVQWFPKTVAVSEIGKMSCLSISLASCTQAGGRKAAARTKGAKSPATGAVWVDSEAVDQQWNLSIQGYTPDNIRKLSIELGTFTAIAQVFSTTYSKSCGLTEAAIHQQLSSGNTTPKEFLDENTQSYKRAERTRYCDPRPGRRIAEKAIAAQVARHGAADQDRHVKTAIATLSQKILSAKQQELKETRATRMDAQHSMSAQFRAQMATKIKRIVGDLQQQFVDDSKPKLTINTCKWHPPRQTPVDGRSGRPLPRLSLTWMLQDKQHGNQMVSLMQLLPEADGSGKTACGVITRLHLWIRGDEKVLLLQPILSDQGPKALLVLTDLLDATTSFHLVDAGCGECQSAKKISLATWVKGVDSVVYDDCTRCLAVLSLEKGTIQTFTLDIKHAELQLGTTIDVLQLPSLRSMQLVPGSKELLAFSSNRVDTVNPCPSKEPQSGTLYLSQPEGVADLQLLVTPDGKWLLELSCESGSWQLAVRSLSKEAELFHLINRSPLQVPCAGHLLKDIVFKVGIIDERTFLVAYHPSGSGVAVITLTLAFQPVISLQEASEMIYDPTHGFQRFQVTKDSTGWRPVLHTAAPLREWKEPCSVCLEPAMSGSCLTPCKHIFHARCLEDWKQFTPEGGCPVCRASL